jgi:ornithine cyclodeaminase/alanine dehydrogenase-like protein (mu-crystallin family)
MTPEEGVLVLTNDDVKEIVDLPSYIEALELAYRQLAAGLAQNMPRQRLFLPLAERETHHWFNLHAGSVPATRTAALRVNSGRVRFETHFGAQRMEFPGALVGLVLLFAVDTGALLAIIHDFYINPIRVACTSALGVKHLAREDSRVMGLLGTGWQARWHLSALMEPRAFSRIQVYSPNPEHRIRFVRRQRERFPAMEIQAVESEEQAVRGADVVVTATNALTPVLKGEWLAAGTHIVSISGGDRLDQRKEVDDETVARSSVVVVNSKLQVELDDQQDLLPVVTSGRQSMDRVIELGTLILGGLGRPRSAGEITFHFNNTGMGIQFAAVGTRMYEAAIKRGVGTRLRYTWRGRAE